MYRMGVTDEKPQHKASRAAARKRTRQRIERLAEELRRYGCLVYLPEEVQAIRASGPDHPRAPRTEGGSHA